MHNLLLTGAFSYSEKQKEQLARLGCRIYFMQQEGGNLPIEASQVEMVVCNGLFLHHDVDEFANLRYVQLTSAGLDRVPLNRIRERKIMLHNARGVYGIPMAEWVMFRVLERYKQAGYFWEQQLHKNWLKHRELREIMGCRVAIIGAGNVGKEVAKRLTAFGAKVVGYDIQKMENQYFEKIKLIGNFIEDVCTFDIVVITAPLTNLTFHLISEEVLSHLKHDAILVNIARGALIDEKALNNILKVRPDIYVVLDVFEKEPLPEDNPLWKYPNIALSPHNSYVSNGNNKRLFSLIYDNLKTYLLSI